MKFKITKIIKISKSFKIMKRFINKKIKLIIKILFLLLKNAILINYFVKITIKIIILNFLVLKLNNNRLRKIIIYFYQIHKINF